MVTKRKKPVGTPRPSRGVKFVQVPPEQAKQLLDAAIGSVLSQCREALKELEKY